MIENINQFAAWVFESITKVWNFSVNNQLLQFIIAYILLSFIVDHYKKYFGK